ncbi:hypothetical protein F5884DRAFT_402325 [Xylogone sp. PMI_703]|nr:hypothetical protein F5884DRAFT_402325 [Xylogone sp. PMI_703]
MVPAPIISSTMTSEDSRNASNGHGVSQHHPLIPGVYVPTVVFFDSETEDIDFKILASHTLRLARAGVTGIAVQGSNGEAVHLNHDERKAVTKRTRDTLDAAGYTSMPLIVGCGAQSTRETIALCEEAYQSGGDYALVLPPSYYQSLHAPTTIIEFFTEVANKSPIPIIIYNFPGAVSGLDLNSTTLITLGHHPNIVGCKFTCGNTGKLNRVAAALKDADQQFLCFGGSGDFTLPTLMAGGAGIIAGIANIAPKVCVRVMQLYRQGEVKEAQALQEVLARGDWTAIKSGVLGTKLALQEYWGYGGWGRRPLPRIEGEERERIVKGFEELVESERELEEDGESQAI